MYGKLVNGQLQYASNQLIVDGMLIVNPSKDKYEAQGYLEVVNSEYPNVPVGFIANSHYEQQENKIVQVWDIKKDMSELPQNEIVDMFLNEHIQDIKADDTTALRMKSRYPKWEKLIGQTLSVGFKFTYQKELWKVRQEHLVQEQFKPSLQTASLYERIEEKHLGNKYDAIPYTMEMAVEKGKYYVYQDVMYKCIRTSGQPLYATPNSLLGNYFENVI